MSEPVCDVLTIECDVLVVGGGLAAASAVMHAMEQGVRVCMAVKGRFGAVGQRGAGASSCGTTYHGSPRVPGPHRPGGYEAEQEYGRIVTAGLGMVDRTLAQALVEGAEELGEAVSRWGVVWGKRGPVGLGYPIVSTLERFIRRAGVEIFENTMVADLLVHEGRCVGAVAVQEAGGAGRSGSMIVFRSSAVVLATGGDAELFRHNVHPPCVTGDGYAMALRAGASLMNMEFMQIFFCTPFPTKNLYHVWHGTELGRVRNRDGREFLADYLPEGITVHECVEENLRHAPFSTRDRASRYLAVGMVREIQAGRGTEAAGVLLDPDPPAGLMEREQQRFLLYRGVDITGTIQLTMGHQCSNGGLRIGADAMSTLPGLFAAGEASTGMHGADRIGGNMLACCLVFGAIAGRSAADWSRSHGSPVESGASGRARTDRLTAMLSSPASAGSAAGDRLAAMRAGLQQEAWYSALTVRTEQGLTRMLDVLGSLKSELAELGGVGDVSTLIRALELENLLLVGEAVARAALLRKESRGGHYREDFPAMSTAQPPEAHLVRWDEEERLRVDAVPVDPEWTADMLSIEGGRWG